MAADHGLWSNDHEMILPSWPDSGEHDPERAIDRREPRSRPIMIVDRELLAKRQLDDGLLLATPGEGDDAAKDRDQQDEQRSHGSRRVRYRAGQNESESVNSSGLSSADS